MQESVVSDAKLNRVGRIYNAGVRTTNKVSQIVWLLFGVMLAS